MGNCSDCCKPRPISDKGKTATTQFRTIPLDSPEGRSNPAAQQSSIQKKVSAPISLTLRYDTGNNMCSSYKKQSNLIEKIIYNWHSFPITSKIQQSQASFFRIKNCGIKDDNFVVGIIKLTAIIGSVKVPWKTQHTICFESHHQTGQSGIIFENNITHCGRGIKKGETLTVIVRRQQIEFKIQAEVLGKKHIPSEFYTDQICPYICLFNKEDKIEFPDGIQIDQRGR